MPVAVTGALPGGPTGLEATSGGALVPGKELPGAVFTGTGPTGGIAAGGVPATCGGVARRNCRRIHPAATPTGDWPGIKLPGVIVPGGTVAGGTVPGRAAAGGTVPGGAALGGVAGVVLVSVFDGGPTGFVSAVIAGGWDAVGWVAGGCAAGGTALLPEPGVWLTAGATVAELGTAGRSCCRVSTSGGP